MIEKNLRSYVRRVLSECGFEFKTIYNHENEDHVVFDVLCCTNAGFDSKKYWYQYLKLPADYITFNIYVRYNFSDDPSKEDIEYRSVHSRSLDASGKLSLGEFNKIFIREARHLSLEEIGV